MIFLSFLSIGLTFLAYESQHDPEYTNRAFFGPSLILPIYSVVLLRYLIQYTCLGEIWTQLSYSLLVTFITFNGISWYTRLEVIKSHKVFKYLICLNICVAIFMIMINKPHYLPFYQFIILIGFLADVIVFYNRLSIIYFHTYMYSSFMISFSMWGFTCFFYPVFSTFKLPDFK